MTRAATKPENRGIPPARPLPSQLMHLLELCYMNTADAADMLHVDEGSVDQWMTFQTDQSMPTGLWLLLNMNTLALKHRVFPEPTREIIEKRFGGAFVTTNKPQRQIVFVEGPDIASTKGIQSILNEAKCDLKECGELLYESKQTTEEWISGRTVIPYPYYELMIMTLWAQGRYSPTGAIRAYLAEKYNQNFLPKT